jgi:CRP-like cAMP-binding protein
VTPGKRQKSTFDPQVFLAHIGRGRKIVSFPKGRTVFAQGDSCDAVFYIQSGKVKLTVVSATGKEATIAILSEGDFFGEDTLTRHRLRLATVTALTDCNLMRIDKTAMLQVLHRQHRFSDLFTEHLLSRNSRSRAPTRTLGEAARREKCAQRSGTAVIPLLGDLWEAVLMWERLSDSQPLPEVSLQHY